MALLGADNNNIANQLQEKQAAAQQMELQLRIIAVQAATACAKPGEETQKTLERVQALSGYLYSGKI
jgi:hypothetical protein